MAVPKLRFKEFDSDWNKLTLDSIVKSNIIEVDKPTEDYTRLGIRSHCKGTFHQLVKIEDILEADKMFTVPKDNLIVNITFAWEQAIAITDENDEGKLVSGRFPTFAFKNGHLPQFYKFILPNKRLKYDLGLASPGGAGRNKVLNKKEFLKIKIGTTTIEEQKKIADFLTTLDKRITAQQNIIADMEEIKKGLLQKIFSQEIRFKDDNGEDYPAWLVDRLDMFCDISAGGDISKEHICPTQTEEFPYPVYANALENNGFYSYANYFKESGNTFTITGRGVGIGHAVARHEKYVPIVRLLVCKPKHNENVDFMAYAFNQAKFFIESTGVPQLTAPQASKIKVQIPCLEEQNKIASFLSAYDKKIEAEKKILADLQELKKGLLQQMFV